ncbi:MAG: cyclase family protein [Fidelibacterota bacterium]|nr:MAG: cyclase family protein [Candidatus Neomarinimicrobiota bacterium]
MILSLETFSPDRIIDISVTLRQGLACWPGEEYWQLESTQQIAKGGSCNLSRATMSLHMGTHVDAPWHFGEGDRTVEAIPLSQLVIGARVLDLTHVEAAIGRSDLEGKLDGIQAVLLKTSDSGRLEALEPFNRDFVHLDESAAEYLVEQNISTVGIDYLSVEGYHVENAPVHHRLLGAEVLIVEGLDLSGVEARDYLLVVLPLKIEGADGAPARAILIDSDR